MFSQYGLLFTGTTTTINISFLPLLTRLFMMPFSFPLIVYANIRVGEQALNTILDVEAS